MFPLSGGYRPQAASLQVTLGARDTTYAAILTGPSRGRPGRGSVDITGRDSVGAPPPPTAPSVPGRLGPESRRSAVLTPTPEFPVAGDSLRRDPGAAESRPLRLGLGLRAESAGPGFGLSSLQPGSLAHTGLFTAMCRTGLGHTGLQLALGRPGSASPRPRAGTFLTRNPIKSWSHWAKSTGSSCRRPSSHRHVDCACKLWRVV
jgi:hypothetical protein